LRKLVPIPAETGDEGAKYGSRFLEDEMIRTFYAPLVSREAFCLKVLSGSF
jgi:hypothetical protein